MADAGVKTSNEVAAAAITGAGQTIVRAVQGGSNVKLTDDQIRTWAQIFVSLLDLSNASAGQIKMPASQNASDDPNTWDDYEEGTATLVIAFGGAAVGVTYSAQTLNYTKDGNRVLFDGVLGLTSNGSSTGNATIGGLPFTIGASTYVPIQGRLVNLDTAGGRYAIWGTLSSGGTTITLLEAGDNVAAANLTEADVADTAEFLFQGHYRV